MIFDEFEKLIKKVDAWEVNGKRVGSLTEARVMAVNDLMRKELLGIPEVGQALREDSDPFEFEDIQEFVVFIQDHSLLINEYLSALADCKKDPPKVDDHLIQCITCGATLRGSGSPPDKCPHCEKRSGYGSGEPNPLLNLAVGLTKENLQPEGEGKPEPFMGAVVNAQLKKEKTAYCQVAGCGWEGFTPAVPRSCPRCQALSVVNLTAYPTKAPRFEPKGPTKAPRDPKDRTNYNS